MSKERTFDPRLLRNLEVLGGHYCDMYLRRWPDIKDNWWSAFDFFIDHAFMRGRRDKLSTEYCKFAVGVLKRHFDIPYMPSETDFGRIRIVHNDFVNGLEDILRFKRDHGSKLTANSAKDQAFHKEVSGKHPLINELMSDVATEGQRSLNNDKDLMMVLSALAFLTQNIMPANIHNYLVNELKAGKASEVTKALEEIRFIGDKISSFILRDIILMNPELAVDNARLVFPVDTWVFKIANKFGCASDDHDRVRDFFISQLEGRSVAKIAAGIWYMGFNSLEILTANLEDIDMASWKSPINESTET